MSPFDDESTSRKLGEPILIDMRALPKPEPPSRRISQFGPTP